MGSLFVKEEMPMAWQRQCGAKRWKLPGVTQRRSVRKAGPPWSDVCKDMVRKMIRGEAAAWSWWSECQLVLAAPLVSLFLSAFRHGYQYTHFRCWVHRPHLRLHSHFPSHFPGISRSCPFELWASDLQRLRKKCWKLLCIFVDQRVEEDRTCMPQEAQLPLRRCAFTFLDKGKSRVESYTAVGMSLPAQHWPLN